MGDPGGYIESVHNAGGIVMHTVGSAEEARRARVGYRRDTAAGARCVDAVAPVPLIAACEIGAARSRPTARPGRVAGHAVPAGRADAAHSQRRKSLPS